MDEVKQRERFLELAKEFKNDIDYKLINQITLTNDNPFKYFFEYKEFELEQLFEILHTTNLLFKELESSELVKPLSRRERKVKAKKYQFVVDDLDDCLIQEDNEIRKIIDFLVQRKEQILNPIHLTEDRILKSFVYRVVKLKNNNKKLENTLKDMRPICSESKNNKVTTFEYPIIKSPTGSQMKCINLIIRKFFNLEYSYSKDLRLVSYKETHVVLKDKKQKIPIYITQT